MRFSFIHDILFNNETGYFFGATTNCNVYEFKKIKGVLLVREFVFWGRLKFGTPPHHHGGPGANNAWNEGGGGGLTHPD